MDVKVGDKVTAPYLENGGFEFRSGVIKKLMHDGRFRIKFDNGVVQDVSKYGDVRLIIR